MGAIPGIELIPIRTADGSFTLRAPTLDEHYHSIHGAVQESMHVFIRAGLHRVKKGTIDLLEVGLGTGVNALLTWIEAGRLGVTVNYHGIEPHPLRKELLRAVDHPERIGAQDRSEAYFSMMAATLPVQVDAAFHFTPHIRTLQACFLAHPPHFPTSRFDLIYFDAFAPEKQPELWTPEIFAHAFGVLRPGGLLVTYCAKGEVRRTMQRAGFDVERLPGPPGKREMLRATRPA